MVKNQEAVTLSVINELLNLTSYRLDKALSYVDDERYTVIDMYKPLETLDGMDIRVDEIAKEYYRILEPNGLLVLNSKKAYKKKMKKAGFKHYKSDNSLHYYFKDKPSRNRYLKAIERYKSREKEFETMSQKDRDLEALTICVMRDGHLMDTRITIWKEDM